MFSIQILLLINIAFVFAQTNTQNLFNELEKTSTTANREPYESIDLVVNPQTGQQQLVHKGLQRFYYSDTNGQGILEYIADINGYRFKYSYKVPDTDGQMFPALALSPTFLKSAAG